MNGVEVEMLKVGKEVVAVGHKVGKGMYEGIVPED